MKCLTCDRPAVYKKAQMCRKHYQQEYDAVYKKSVRDSDPDFDYEDFWLWVKNRLKLRDYE